MRHYLAGNYNRNQNNSALIFIKSNSGYIFYFKEKNQGRGKIVPLLKRFKNIWFNKY